MNQFFAGRGPVETALVVLAVALGVAAFSLGVSVQAIPRLPRFRGARRQIVWLASASFAASLAIFSWVLRT